MSRKVVAALLLLLVACDAAPAQPAAVVVTAPPSAAPSPTAPHAVCAGREPFAHVYHPVRLREPCRTVTGVVVAIREEEDGDYHINVVLDPGQEGLLNDRNRSQQGGALVAEMVCALPTTEQAARQACAGYQNQIQLPPLGARLAVTGPYVLDAQHGWNEIHPIWEIVVFAPPSPSPSQ